MVHASKQHLGDIFTEQIQTKLVIVLKSMCVMLMSLDILYAGEILMIYNNRNTIGIKYTVCYCGSVFFFHWCIFAFLCVLCETWFRLLPYQQVKKKSLSSEKIKLNTVVSIFLHATQAAIGEPNQSLCMETASLVIGLFVSFCFKIW